jgi:hypothetical protein
MKINVIIHGEKAALVPYLKEHVEKYHKWMQVPLQPLAQRWTLTLSTGTSREWSAGSGASGINRVRAADTEPRV